MTTWHRIDDHGIPVTFSYEPDDRGNVTLTTEQVEGLMRAGGWHAAGGTVTEQNTTLGKPSPGFPLCA